MSARGAAAVAAARRCVGARFRPQGRDPATGMDCVGLVAFAVRASGARLEAPCGYVLRGSVDRVATELADRGFARADAAEPGDILLMRAGAGQAHLGVWTGASIIHADARLRRVVETPGEARWTVVGVWRSGAREVMSRSGAPMDAETSSA